MDGNLNRRLVMYPILDQFLSPFSRWTKSVNRWTDGSDRWLRAWTLRAFSHSVHPLFVTILKVFNCKLYLLQTTRQAHQFQMLQAIFFNYNQHFHIQTYRWLIHLFSLPQFLLQSRNQLKPLIQRFEKKVLKMNEFNFKENKNGDVHEHKYFLCDCEIEREKEEEWWAK